MAAILFGSLNRTRPRALELVIVAAQKSVNHLMKTAML